MWAVVVLILAGGAIVGERVPPAKEQLIKVGPYVDRAVVRATGGRFDPKKYTYNARGKPVAFNK